MATQEFASIISKSKRNTHGINVGTNFISLINSSGAMLLACQKIK